MARCEFFEGVRAKWRRKWGIEWELKNLVRESGPELVVGMVEEVRRREGELSWNPWLKKKEGEVGETTRAKKRTRDRDGGKEKQEEKGTQKEKEEKKEGTEGVMKRKKLIQEQEPKKGGNK